MLIKVCKRTMVDNFLGMVLLGRIKIITSVFLRWLLSPWYTEFPGYVSGDF